MLTFQDITSNVSSDWDDFIIRHPAGTLFHSSSWLDILAKSQNLTIIKTGFFENGILVGVMPIFIKNIWPLRVAASPYLVEDTPYMGLVIDADRFAEALNLLASFMKQAGIHFLRIIQRDIISPEIQLSGFKLIEKHTHVLDLTKSEEEIWTTFEGRCRTAIRKAEKGGVSIKRETSREVIDAYYEILNNLYVGQKMTTPNPKAFYYRLRDAFEDDKFTMLTAWHAETLIAGAIIIHDRDRCYYLNGASHYDYNSLCPNNLIQWEAIRLAKSTGALWYDFVGSDIERLAKFKKSFGGVLISYTCLEKSSSALVSLIRQKYPELKMLKGRIATRLGF